MKRSNRKPGDNHVVPNAYPAASAAGFLERRITASLAHCAY
jgi:hypothetical protein